MHPRRTMPKKFSTWYSRGSPADESDGAKRIIVPLASVGDSDTADARLELVFVSLRDVERSSRCHSPRPNSRSRRSLS